MKIFVLILLLTFTNNLFATSGGSLEIYNNDVSSEFVDRVFAGTASEHCPNCIKLQKEGKKVAKFRNGEIADFINASLGENPYAISADVIKDIVEKFQDVLELEGPYYRYKGTESDLRQRVMSSVLDGVISDF